MMVQSNQGLLFNNLSGAFGYSFSLKMVKIIKSFYHCF